MRRVLIAVAIAVISAVSAVAATTYLTLQPGFSTRADAAKTLGEPVLKLADVLHEHKPQEGTGPIYVEYRLGSDLIDRIEVKLLGPVKRADLIEAMKLPGASVASRIRNGTLTEYFADDTAIALGYAGGQLTSGVTSISYESDQLFARDVARAKAAGGNDVPPATPPPPPTTTPTTPPTAPPTPTPFPGPTTPVAPAPVPQAPPVVTSSTIPPSVKRNPAACYDIFLWADAQELAARRGNQLPRRQRAMGIRLAAQSGDCVRARELTDQYKAQFPER